MKLLVAPISFFYLFDKLIMKLVNILTDSHK